MKKFVLTALCVATLMATSCKKEASEVPTATLGVKPPANTWQSMALASESEGGITVTVTATATTVYSVANGIQTAIYYSVTPNDSRTHYLPSGTRNMLKGSVINPTATAGAYTPYVFDNGVSLLPGGHGDLHATSGGVIIDAHGNYAVHAGQVVNFVLNGAYDPSVPGSYHARLVNLNQNTNDSATEYSLAFQYNLKSGGFGSPYVAGQ